LILRMIKYLNPIDQLFELNREVIPSLEKFEHPIIVVGGQALFYWIDYYLEQKFKTDIFRTARKYMDYFLDVIESPIGLKMETLHGISLLVVVKSLKDNVLDKINDIPEKYLSINLQSRINKIDKKIKIFDNLT